MKASSIDRMKIPTERSRKHLVSKLIHEKENKNCVVASTMFESSYFSRDITVSRNEGALAPLSRQTNIDSEVFYKL